MDIALFMVGIGLIIGFSLIAAVFYHRERKTGRRIYYLKEAMVLGALTGITNVMISGPEFDIFNLGPYTIVRFTLTCWVCVFGLMGLFFMSLRHETPDWRFSGFAIAIGMISITSGFASIGIPTMEGNLVAFVWKSTYALYAIIIMFYGSKVFLDAHRILPEKRSIGLGIVLFLLGFAYILNIILNDYPDFIGVSLIPGVNMETVLDLIRIFMMIVIVMILLTDMEYFYRIPIHVYSIMVNTPTGLNLYQWASEKDASDPSLFASALSAISLVMKESSGSKEPLERVSAGDRCVIIEFREESGILVTAIVERTSMVLIRSVSMFADLYIEKYGSLKDIDVFEKIDESEVTPLVKAAFPFLKTE